ncbi:hypothetical protein MXB_1239 [Myxobolus squamalis]|nr:hypothetical protein MXB_1239 [Myxobolus squamalis]
MVKSIVIESEPIDYSTFDRVVSDIPFIKRERATLSQIYDIDGLPNLVFVKDWFFHEGRFEEEAIRKSVETFMANITTY